MKIKLLSPIHIGAGEEKTLSPYADYIYQGGYVYYIDHNKLENWILSQKNPAQIMDDLIDGIKERKGLKEFFDKYNLSVEDYATHRTTILGDPKKEKIKRIVTNAGLPYIPGSSIKGAIRTAILWKIQKNRKIDFINFMRRYSRKKFSYIGQDIFEKFDNDVMKFLQVSDTKTYSREEIEVVNIKRISLTKPKITLSQRGIPSWVEVIRTQREVNFEMRQKGERVNSIREELAGYLFKKSGMADILTVLNEFSKKIIEFEINVLKNQYFNSVVEFYKRILDEIKNLTNKEAILRIGYGKTFFDNTIDLLFNPEEIDKIRKEENIGYSPKGKKLANPFPITRWICFDTQGNPEGVLGWVKISE